MSPALIAFLIVFVLVFLLGMRIPYGLMGACVVYFLVSGTNVKMVAQLSMSYIFNSFTMIAIPLFVFTANIMNEGNITERVFGVAKGLVGRWHGGLGHVNVLASLIFSGMTGSAVADAAGLGKMEITAMRKEGYDDGFSCAITAASAVIGPIFPPSIPMVIYSMISGASIGALFMGGMVPGVLLAIALMLYVAFVAKKRNYPTSRITDMHGYWLYLLKSLPAIMTPVILLLGIYTGVVTATEAGAIAGLYALIVAIFGYRMMTPKKFFECVKDSVANSGAIIFSCGIAAAINYIVAREQIATNLGLFISSVTSNKYVFLFLVNIVFLILGMFIDTTVIQLVFVPLIIPVATSMGIDLVHLGLVLCYNMMVGLVTPPYGGLLFITSATSGTPLQTVVKSIIPVLIPMLIVLFVLTYVPEITLFLPTHLMGYVG